MRSREYVFEVSFAGRPLNARLAGLFYRMLSGRTSSCTRPSDHMGFWRAALKSSPGCMVFRGLFSRCPLDARSSRGDPAQCLVLFCKHAGQDRAPPAVFRCPLLKTVHPGDNLKLRFENRASRGHLAVRGRKPCIRGAPRSTEEQNAGYGGPCHTPRPVEHAQ